MSKCVSLLLASFIALSLRSAAALEDVTAIASSFVGGSPSLAEGYTFENTARPITGLTTGVSNYAILGVANNVFVRRNGVSPNQSSVWYADGTAPNLAGVHQNNYAQMLLSNNLNAGSDNTFSNAGTGPTTGNIERLDFTWNSSVTVSNALAFGIFDRGVAALHDSFAIAAITAVDVLGNPTAFGSLLKVASGWGGGSNPGADMSYRLFRYNNGDAISASTESAETNRQGIGGVIVRAFDLGLVPGQQIYGYSLMSVDVTATNSTQLLDWTNGTFFPTNSDGTTGGGGIDLAAVNGLAFIAVPEPATWGFLLVGLGFAGFCAARKQRSLV